MTVTLADGMLDLAMPMHLRLDAGGRIVGAGPAMRKTADTRALVGQVLLDVFAVHRPAGLRTFAQMSARPGRRLVLGFREGRNVEFRGHILDAAGNGAFVLNLTFGLADLPDLGGAGLTAADFAPTDPTVDTLYLLEAKQMAFSEMRRLVERLRGAKSVAEEQAFTDTLTGLRNRRALDQVMAQSRERAEPFALCQVDLDHFKQVNDTHGHAAGDAVLRAVAARLSHSVRAADTVARVGGDEFILILPGMTDEATLARIARRIVTDIEGPVRFEGRDHRVSASIGITVSTDYADPDPVRMFADADAALYRSKSAGRATHCFHGQPA